MKNSTTVLVEKNLKLLNYNNLSKKALFSAFFYGLILCTLKPAFSATSADRCASPQFDEKAKVKYVHDGDTLHLTDKRKIRLIGIDTPELARKGKTTQPYAIAAKKALKALVATGQNKIGLIYGRDKLDHYGRTLAHLFLTTGTNIQAELISQGLAVAYTTPPNTRYSECYANLESHSRQSKKGFWTHDKYAIRHADTLLADTKGFLIIKGTVNKLNLKSKNIWIKLENNINVQIREKDRHYFNTDELSCLRGKPIQIRGWLHPDDNGFYMSLRHPSALDISEANGC